MGEEIGNDELIMPFISSANIACGAHAGSDKTMYETVLLAKRYNIKIGAHPSFLDRKNFGRVEMKSTPLEIYNTVTDQIRSLQNIAEKAKCKLHHVKPHGALYNMAAKDQIIAASIAMAVKDCDQQLKVYGLSNSFLISESRSIGLKTVSEVFADRTYLDDGSLTPRSKPNALISDPQEAIQQVLRMIKTGKVRTTSNKEIPIFAESVCIHGDGKNAVEFSKEINAALIKENITIGSLK